MDNIFVVLGESRSGTSALTRGLSIINLDIGTNLRPPASGNPRGFFEDRSVLSLNRVISRALKDPCLNVKSLHGFEEFTQPVFKKYANYAKKIIHSRLKNKSAWAFKDPRTMVTLPFWQEIFSEIKINDHYIIMVRHPLASAKSTELFNGHDAEMLLMTWVYNYVAAIDETHGKPRVVILYDQLLTDTRNVYQRIIDNLNLRTSVNSSLLDEYTNSFLDKRLNHHATHASYDLSSICLKLYNLLSRLANDELRFGTPEFENEWHEFLKDFKDSKILYEYTHQIYCENKSLQKEIRLTRRSLIWRLAKPFHYINDILRKRKNSVSELKRLAKVC